MEVKKNQAQMVHGNINYLLGLSLILFGKLIIIISLEFQKVFLFLKKFRFIKIYFTNLFDYYKFSKK